MIEKYLLRAGCDKEFFCVLEYDTEKDKFRAYRINDNGAAVIPFLKKRKEKKLEMIYVVSLLKIMLCLILERTLNRF